MKQKVILISGKLQSGKNTFANYLEQSLVNNNLTVTQDLYAKDVKDWCKSDFQPLVAYLNKIVAKTRSEFGVLLNNSNHSRLSDWNYHDNMFNDLLIEDDNWYEKKKPITRLLLQLYGTEIFRKRIDNDWWVNQVKKRLETITTDVIIITDLRFENEIIQSTDKYDVYTIRIHKDINTNDIHLSEISLDHYEYWDYVVDNNRTLEDLEKSANLIASDLYTIKDIINDHTGLLTRLNNKKLIINQEWKIRG